MTSVPDYLEALRLAADEARSVEAAYRREAAARIALLEQERAFAFRRMNLMQLIAETVRPRQTDGVDTVDGSGEEIAVAGALAALRTRLGWSSDSEARDATLARFAPVAGALYRASVGDTTDKPGVSPDVAKKLAGFEAWYEETHGVSFWTLFENPMPDTPRIDF
ncbi:hypothetical protein ATN84_16520 [Paramesorhizobium deserti]|uniref:Uncharacterized protein n=1 Tax=Paramesorhizobium deserti TaxID=1494590 RepID=A0A135HQW1_9HYPH|nr:hypothetical protein [Paramesorhizobium deserti]KXF75597.1 hypothetical protein ATN84_16520 [Paramesorhizobium deserti]